MGGSAISEYLLYLYIFIFIFLYIYFLNINILNQTGGQATFSIFFSYYQNDTNSYL